VMVLAAIESLMPVASIKQLSLMDLYPFIWVCLKMGYTTTSI
jgi:hypothetical protein